MSVPASQEALFKRLHALTPEQRAALARKLPAQTLGSVPDSLRTASPSDPAPASCAQQRMWFLQQYAPASPAYHCVAAFRICGPLQVAAIEDGIAEIVRRHETLRTTFVAHEAEAIQVVAPPTPFRLTVADILAAPETEREAGLHRLLHEEASRPFDLTTGPIFRAVLARMTPDDHTLLCVWHHIIFDGWSLGVFCRELSAFYAAHAIGQAAALPSLPLQFAHWAARQKDASADPAVRDAEAWWLRKLDGAPPTLDLPTPRPRPPSETFRGETARARLRPGLSAALAAMAAREGVTLFMLLLAAFKTLLLRYTGQEDLLVGTPIAGRTRLELEGLIGLFVNTLVLRTDLSGNPPFRELLHQVKQTVIEAWEHPDVPFERLVERLHVRRDPSHAPVFQVVFTWRDFPEAQLDLPGLTVERRALDTGTAKFDLSVFVERVRGELEVAVEYSTDLFDRQWIEHLLDHWQRLLEGVAADPTQRIGDLPLLAPEERRLVLVEWNQTAIAYPRDQSIHQVFEDQAKRTPDSVAVEFLDQRLTYAELHARSNQLAHYLRRLGVKHEAPVGICMDRSLDMVLGLLGILKAGGAYVPLDPSYPAERLQWMLQDTGTRVMLSHSGSSRALPAELAALTACVLLDDLKAPWSAEPVTTPPSSSQASDLAYIIYTSGTTGRPKGVLVPHRGVVRLARGANYAELNEREVFLQFAPLAFDASTFEIWCSLLNGAKLVIAPPGWLTFQELARVIREHGVTTLWLTASLFHQVVQEAPEVLTGVRQLLTGGEALSPDAVREYLQLPEHGQLINGYGPTENTTFTCGCRLDDAQALTSSVPIGRPISNTQVYILDRGNQPVPAGVTGEIYAGGDGLARGYLNAPELTGEKFVPHPFSSEPGARLYRTGDLGRWLPDGRVEFLGRTDRQVKVRGYRIELGEIESVLATHRNVQACAVLARKDQTGANSLVAYGVARQTPAASAQELQTFLAQRLPAYMIPAHFIFLGALPITPNGKLDHEALPAPERGPAPGRLRPRRPRNALQLRLLEIWERVLGRRPIGIDDDFFDLGGHSLLAVRLVSEINRALGLQLGVLGVFQHPTIQRLAAAVSEADYPKNTPIVPLQTRGDRPPLLFMQSAFAAFRLAHHLGPAQPSYGFEGAWLVKLVKDAFEGRPAATLSLKEIAAPFLPLVRSVRPHGPYWLAGYSFAGLLAFEVAHQLQQEGEEVPRVLLLDTRMPQGDELVKNASPPPTPLRGVFEELLTREVWPFYIQVYNTAARSYRPPPLASRGLLVVSTDTARLWPGHASDGLGWSNLFAGGLEIVPMPGDHQTILTEPLVQDLAGKLTTRLGQACPSR